MRIRSAPPRTQPINQLEVLTFLTIPAIGIDVFVSPFCQAFTRASIPNQLQYSLGQSNAVAGREKAYDTVIEVIRVYGCAGHHDRYTLGHKLQDLRAVSFVPERICSFRNDPKIRIRYHVWNPVERYKPTKSDLFVETELEHQAAQPVFQCAGGAIKMEFGVWRLVFQGGESLNRNI